MSVQRSMRNIQHFIWDFDGTLFDTYPVIIGDLRKALGQFGYGCDPVEAMGLMLTNILVARNYYADKYGIDREALASAYQEHHRQTVELFSAEPMEGVQEVLANICASERYNYIFTHRKVDETVRCLEKYGLDRYFREIIGPESPGFAWKPAPDAVLYLMEKYGMTPQDTVMVGDRECDLGSARNAHIGTVHYVCAAVPETLACQWRVESFGEMLALL